MNEEESVTFLRWIEDYAGDEKLKILNVGSGDAEYYKVRQPNIWQSLMLPLIGQGHTIVNLDLKEGDGIDLSCPLSKIPVADGSYDVVLFSSVIEHIKPDEIKESINQIYRVLKPGGLLVASAPAVYPRHDVYDNGIRIRELEQWEHYFGDSLWNCIDSKATNPLPPKPFYKDFKEDTFMTMFSAVKRDGNDVTIVCAQWKRFGNLSEIRRGIESQTYPVRTVLYWDNSSRLPMETSQKYVTINSQVNFQSIAKNVVALLAETEYVLFQDDDLKLHPRTVEVMIEQCRKCPESVICLKYGVENDDGEYVASNYSDVGMPVDYPVGRVMLMRSELVGESFNPTYRPILDIGEEDLVLGLSVQMLTKKPAYVVPISLCKPIELPAPSGRVSRPWHKANRTKTIQMFKERGWKSYRW